MKNHKWSKLDQDHLGRVVRAIGTYKGTLRQFSEESGIPYPSLHEYASGKRKPGFDALAAITKTSGVSPLWILTGEGEMFSATTKEVLIDAEVVRQISVEFMIARILTADEDREGLGKAALETAALDRKSYERFVASRAPVDLEDLRKKIEDAEREATYMAVVYNITAKLPDAETRTRRIRREVFELLELMRQEQLRSERPKQSGRTGSHRPRPGRRK